MHRLSAAALPLSWVAAAALHWLHMMHKCLFNIRIACQYICGCCFVLQAVETRELTASMLSSSHSSDGFPTAVLEEDEEDLLEEDCSSELDESSEQDHSSSSLAGSPMVLSTSQPQQPPQPSRLAVMTAASGELAGEQVQQPGGVSGDLAHTGKVPSADMGSVISEGTTCNLGSAMSLGRPGVDGDLLFDLDDDSGSSAAHTPVGREVRCARGASPLGRLPAAAGSGSGVGVAAAEQEDVVMAAAGSLRQAEALSQYLSNTVQLQTPPPSAFSRLAAASSGADGEGGDGRGAAAVSVCGTLSAGGSLCSPLGPALSGPISDGGAGDMARSMQVASGGWMFRDLKAGLATVGRCMNVKKTAGGPRRRTGLHKAMYPPPVIRAPPRSTNEVLGGLSEQQWQAFMQELLAFMDDALRPGKGAWRGASQAAGLGTVAMSCPRF